MGDGRGARQFYKNKVGRNNVVNHACQSCGDEAEAWMLSLRDHQTRPDRIIWLCHQCSPGYHRSAIKDYGDVGLVWQGW